MSSRMYALGLLSHLWKRFLSLLHVNVMACSCNIWDLISTEMLGFEGLSRFYCSHCSGHCLKIGRADLKHKRWAVVSGSSAVSGSSNGTSTDPGCCDSRENRLLILWLSPLSLENKQSQVCAFWYDRDCFTISLFKSFLRLEYPLWTRSK